MARKNGKSALGAGLALWSLYCGDAGGEVYSVAGTRDQARIVFGAARRMVELDGELSGLSKVYRDAIEVPGTGAVYRVLSREAGASEGLSPTFVVFDEVHVQPDDELWNVMQLGAGARREPVLLGITTAGARSDTHGRDSLCYRLYQHGRRVVAGEVEDPTFFFSWWEPRRGAEAVRQRVPRPHHRPTVPERHVRRGAARAPGGDHRRHAADGDPVHQDIFAKGFWGVHRRSRSKTARA
jgi:phage terminase large subunit-like protein